MEINRSTQYIDALAVIIARTFNISPSSTPSRYGQRIS
jgi:hypothetical protein